MPDAGPPDLLSIYDSLWRDGEAAFARKAVGIDPHLADREVDRRRGVSVVLRLETPVRREIEGFVAEIRPLEPQQYYYAFSEYHVTVLSLLTCADDYEPTHVDGYARAMAEAVRGVGSFRIRFEGVTATAEAVMIQGFPDDALALLRARIFERVTAHHLPQRQRYFPRTAHVTLMRFGQPPADLPGLAEKIRASRRRSFGSTWVTQIELVENDWYMSEHKTQVIGTFEL